MILTDYIFITIIGLSTLFGFARGFIREIFTVLNMALASGATYFAYPHSYDLFAGQVKSETAVQALAVICPFIVFWVALIIINSFAIKSLGGMKGKFVDRIIGTLFGLLRGSVVIALIYLNTVFVAGAQEDPEKLPDWMKNAQTHNLAKMTGEVFLGFIPKDIQKCYKFADVCTKDEITGSLMRSSLYSESEKKLIQMGLDKPEIQTLSRIYHDMPEDFGTKLNNDEIAKLDDPKLIKEYGKALISDYKKAVEAKEVPQNISEDELDSLSKSLDKIHPPRESHDSEDKK